MSRKQRRSTSISMETLALNSLLKTKSVSYGYTGAGCMQSTLNFGLHEMLAWSLYIDLRVSCKLDKHQLFMFRKYIVRDSNFPM